MGYPNATYSPSPKTNGQTIQAAWFNDPDNEIVAIEDGLRTGLQHGLTVAVAGITQSASTGSNNFAGPSSMATLQVNGASTFAGNVVFTGTVTLPGLTFSDPATFSSGAIISTGVIRQNSLPMFNVWSSATTARAGGSSAAGVNFNSQDYVRGSIEHSTGVSSSQVHIGTTGVYSIAFHGSVASAANDSPTALLTLWLNDATALLQAMVSPIPSTGPIDPMTISARQDVRIASSGYLTLVATASSGAGTLTFGSPSALTGLRLMGHFIG